MLPDTIEQRKDYSEMIDRAVNLMNEIDTLNADLSQLKAEVEENFGKEIAKDYPKMYKAKHKCGLEQAKAEEKAREAEERAAELSILENLKHGGSSDE